MRIFDETKNKELKKEDIDYNKGFLKEDILIIHHDVVEEVKEEGFYKTIKEYENGGKDVEWVVTKEGIKGKEAYDEEEKIQVYIKYSEKELLKINSQKEMFEIKEELNQLDVKTMKFVDGALTAAEYEPFRQKKIDLRKRYNELEKNV